jgi:hypothetical protein
MVIRLNRIMNSVAITFFAMDIFFSDELYKA